MIISKVAEYAEREGLQVKGSRWVAALSGGADSVCLLRVLLELGCEVVAAHCNFGLRGEESRRDEEFVGRLCRDLGVPLRVKRFATEEEARARGESVEMAARRLRYEWFEQLRREEECAAVAVAHHKGDQVETVLLNLLRGSGVSGLRGMLPRSGHVVRPLLCLEKREILDYLKEQGQAYVTDSTNLEPVCKRNRLRLEVLPLLRELNPSVDEALCRTAGYMREAEEVIRQWGVRSEERGVRSEEGREYCRLSDVAPPRTWLHYWLAPRGFNRTQIEQILEARAGSRFLAAKWQLFVGEGELCLAPWPPGEIPYILKVEEEPYEGEWQISKDAWEATLDADLLEGELSLRRAEAGDRFYPYGMRGSKLVGDYLTNLKVRSPEREEQLVVCCGERIAWLVGRRTDARFAVGEATRRIARLRLETKI